MTCAGYLQREDPLYTYLQREIQPKIGLSGDCAYRVYRLHGSNSVYLYEETRSRTRIIGKFCARPGGNRFAAHDTIEQEFRNLNYMRSMGFRGECGHYIARPLGINHELNELLVEEFCYGEPLSSLLIRCIRSGNRKLLYAKLTALAWFLSRFHNRTANGKMVEFDRFTRYGRGVLQTIRNRFNLDWSRFQMFQDLVNIWQSKPQMYQDQQVIVHGDATPENFLFGDGLHVISFDLERMRCADRLFDVGRLAAELAHFFMLYSGNRGQAEPFIGHFLWEYSCHFPDRQAAFRSVCTRLPFYMGVNFLRIARNSYFDGGYRQKLLNAAQECLTGGLR